MKRDIDLCRQILLAVEAYPHPIRHGRLKIEGHEREEIAHHVWLLRDAGLVEAQNLSTLDGVDWRPTRLTYAGHEFLDASRNETVWQKAKRIVLETTGSLTLKALEAVLLKQVVERALGGS